MATPQIATVDCGTGVHTVRDMTAEEVVDQEAFNAEMTERQAEREAAEAETVANKASGEAKLADLGLSADEIAALVG